MTEETKKKLKVMGDGMFRLIAFWIDELELCFNADDVTDTLEHLPSSLNDMGTSMEIPRVAAVNLLEALEVLHPAQEIFGIWSSARDTKADRSDKDTYPTPNVRDSNPSTSLYFACFGGHIDVVELLLQKRSEWGTGIPALPFISHVLVASFTLSIYFFRREQILGLIPGTYRSWHNVPLDIARKTQRDDIVAVFTAASLACRS
ncbi:hypothetical protein BDN67DRAFT_1017715 [Paxillus ammoniavirescens]|nr:hypothetical protein BDN67DRAFT_1017715 [Paxillus ammoniavirescens]